VLGHLQVITINNVKEKTYTQLISGGPVCGVGFWCRISAWHGEYLLMLRDAYVAVMDVFLKINLKMNYTFMNSQN
jgi:hypothetical protein